jgi:hypothetical protein
MTCHHPRRRGLSYYGAISIRPIRHHLRRNNLAMNCQGSSWLSGWNRTKHESSRFPVIAFGRV